MKLLAISVLINCFNIYINQTKAFATLLSGRLHITFSGFNNARTSAGQNYLQSLNYIIDNNLDDTHSFLSISDSSNGQGINSNVVVYSYNPELKTSFGSSRAVDGKSSELKIWSDLCPTKSFYPTFNNNSISLNVGFKKKVHANQPNAHLLFRSGFEGNVTLSGTRTGNTYTEKRFSGNDLISGFAWPIYAWKAIGTYIQTIAYGGYKVFIDNSKFHLGSKSLYQELSSITTRDGGSSNQIPLMWNPSNSLSEQKDLYTSQWIYLQADLASQLIYSDNPLPNGLWGNWRVLWEWKTGGLGAAWGGDLRTLVTIKKNYLGKLYWETNVDNKAGNSFNYPCNNACWSSPAINTNVPVPSGKWFRFETFTHRSNKSDGHFWAKVDGQKIVDRFQMNVGSNSDPINRVMLSTVYTNGNAPAYQWVDDIEIWDSIPDANSSAMYNNNQNKIAEAAYWGEGEITNESTNVLNLLKPETNKNISARAISNPNTNSIDLVVKSHSKKQISVKIYNTAGQLLEHVNILSATNTVKFTHQFLSGIYYAQISQGLDILVLKIIK